MNLKLLLAILALFLLPGCVHSLNDDAPASDLDVLVMNVKVTAVPIKLPNGKEFCAEEAKTEQAQDDCLGDLEDALFNGNRRSERVVKLVERYAARERLRRNPCTWWEKLRRASRCQIPPQ